MKSINKLKFFTYFALIAILVIYLTKKEKNYYIIPTFADSEVINVVVEIPAGTNAKIEYIPDANKFAIDQLNGKDRIIEFLPYPFNYGFIPSTYMDPLEGGDGDALDVVLLSESKPTKAIIRAIPIALIQLIDNDEIDTKIIAIPKNSNQRIIDVKSLQELENKYPSIISIIEQWFLNYKGNKQITIKSWQGKQEAINEIKKWQNQ